MLHNKDKLWVKVLSHKYMGNTSLWMNKKHNKPSITWRDIHHLLAPNNLDERLQDAWTLRHAKKDEYTCSSGYYWLFQQNRDLNVNCNMNWLWRLKVPSKLQHFLWLCFHNVLHVCWHHCNMVASPSCTRCSSPIEDILHCLHDCPHSRELCLHGMTKGPFVILFVT